MVSFSGRIDRFQEIIVDRQYHIYKYDTTVSYNLLGATHHRLLIDYLIYLFCIFTMKICILITFLMKK